MMFLVLRAYWKLMYFDLYLAHGNFLALYERVRKCRLGRSAATPYTSEMICAAIDIACVWYWKRALCLQRSAATTCLLRTYGIPGQLMIGAQQLPFKAHAWVEVNGCVVNDKSYVREIYAVLDRC